MFNDPQDCGHGITRIDVHYIRPGLACCYLVEEQGRAVLIETGPQLAVPRLLKVLEQKKIARENVVAVLVTHVHLDHAGGAGLLLQHLPNAQLYVHPKGAKHLIDPAKLKASAITVYGEERFLQTLGGLTPIPANRVVTPKDEDTFLLMGREFQFLHTPGHAIHHQVVWDRTSRGIFSGDALGISYRECDGPKGRFLFPATTPVQFDPKNSLESIDRLLALKPERLHLTHFDSIPFDSNLMVDLKQQLEAYSELAWGIRADTLPDKDDRLLDGIKELSWQRLQAIGSPLNKDQSTELLSMDWGINVQGLNHWLNRLEQSLT
ncbi:MAG: MBL fold metallo-hydrolase [Magnetococcales bacterium]|nr:MBL fold metallo-hydrolase [Magnetococcales bacterium]MBF0420412.1 MBL fold metallo-hydrolase [Magnetococcales bacterium]